MVNCIVLVGSPSDGFTYYGPFESNEAALEWAEEQRFAESWWVAFLDAVDSV